MFTTLKLIHILAAILWLGAGYSLLIMNVRLARASDQVGLRVIGEQGEVFGKVVFGPASIVTLLAGIGMVLDHDGYGFSDAWISIGFAGVIVSIVLGAVMIERASKELRATVEENGPDDPAAARLQNRIMTLSAIDLAVLTVVVWAMVAKPGA